MILPHDAPQVHAVSNGSRGWQLYYVNPITEKRVWRSAHATTEAEAHRDAGQWEAELRSRQDRPQGLRTTWEDFRVQYLREKLHALAPKTLAAAETALNSISDFADPARPASITTDVLSRYANHLRQLGRSESTVASYLRDIMIALRWAERRGIVGQVPIAPEARPTKSRGRPITGEEFDRLLAAVDHVDDCQADREAWKWDLRALWWSGLRLDESHRLSWDEIEPFAAIERAGEWFFRIHSDGQKSRRDQTIAVAPEFAEMLDAVPAADRHGPILHFAGRHGRRVSANKAGRIISSLGRHARIRTSRTGHCTAHDLRRSFGTRWAMRVLPAVLQQMMRHASIQTTMAYYVEIEAADLSAAIKSAFVNASVNAKPQYSRVNPTKKASNPYG